jgi:hypothetical protein
MRASIPARLLSAHWSTPRGSEGLDIEVSAVDADRPGRVVLHGLLDLRPTLPLKRIAMATDEAVARALALAKVYAYASVDSDT